MKIKWYGHSCFGLTAENGKRVITDPFDGSIGYKIPTIDADIVTVSHDHYDHNYVEAVRGNPEIVKTPGSHRVKGIKIHGFKTYHDDVQGQKRGENIIFVIEIDGIRVCHLGDLGHILTRDKVKEIGEVDVLLIPVGGTFTIDACDAKEVVEQLKPRIIIPMHYKTEDVSLPIAPVEEFLEKMGMGEQVEDNSIRIRKDELPPREEPVLYVLDYS
jgi:L-ascorbate metabolism protein UlaG (beta-lactamase superfamily)